jgi:alanine racemase
MTHFSDADGAKGIAHQLRVFEETTQGLPGERTLANSAASLRFGDDPAVRGDWIRPGIAVYGSAPDYPDHDTAHWELQPTMTLASRLIATQDLKPGDTVGYGSSFTADRAMRIGVVACGYADGYPRHCTTGTPILVDGVRTQLVARVSMDMLTVDLTPVPGARIGSEVTLWGRASNGAIQPIDEVARAAGTLGYELMCAVAQRVAFGVDA